MLISDTGNSLEHKPQSLRNKKGKLSAVSNCDKTGYPSTGPVLDGSVSINCQNKCVKELIEKGFDCDTIDPHGQTALITAVIVGHLKCTETLIKAGANINITDNNGHTAAIKGVIYGGAKCLNKLKMAGADVGTADKVSQTALIHASKKVTTE